MTRIVFTTFANEEDARRITRLLVEERLAACATFVSGATSIFRWKETVEENAEVFVLLKTTAERFEELSARLSALHPYETPEIVALDCSATSKGYGAWLEECCQP